MIQRYDIHNFGITPHYQGGWVKANAAEALEKENYKLKAKMEIIEDELTIAYMAGFKKGKEKNDE